MREQCVCNSDRNYIKIQEGFLGYVQYIPVKTYSPYINSAPAVCSDIWNNYNYHICLYCMLHGQIKRYNSSITIIMYQGGTYNRTVVG